MAGFFQNLLKDATTGIGNGFFGVDYLRDYDHASKIFRSNSYALAPKFKFLFHVYFEINEGNYAQPFPEGYNLGLLVKSVKLPNYTIQQAEYNQYNRKRLVQTKIKYDNIDITWHDDHSNLMRKLWFNYYTYYYSDALNKTGVSNYPTSVRASKQNNINFTDRTQYKEFNTNTGIGDWGFSGETVPGTFTGGTGPTSGVKWPFFKNIHIFSFSQHKVTQYTLVNPMIASFGHDTHAYSEGNGTMENRMSIAYEFVKYSEGEIDGREPSAYTYNFAGKNYDHRVSPVMQPGANGNILGQGGLVDAVGGFSNDLASGNILGAIRTAGVAYNTFKNGGLKKAVQSEIKSQVSNILTTTASNIPRNLGFSFNSYGQTGTSKGTAGAPNSGTSQPPPINSPGGY
jgi:hypothetical protein